MRIQQAIGTGQMFETVTEPSDDDPVITLGSQRFVLGEIMDAASSLFSDRGPSEYSRGVCELLGRLVLDYGNGGEGTGENAAIFARALGVS